MSFRHGKNTQVIAGAYNLSAYFNDASSSASIETGETTTYGQNAKTYITGLSDGTFSLSGLFDADANTVDPVLSAALGSDDPVAITIAPEGTTIGRRVKSGNSIYTSYEISSPVADVVSVSAEAQITAGIANGVSLHSLTAETATGNATSVDNAASSSNGGVGFLHVTANAHNASTTFKIQHSADNSTWADLVTFASVSTSTVTSERKTATGTVNRYLRASWTFSGSGSVTFHVNFARS